MRSREYHFNQRRSGIKRFKKAMNVRRKWIEESRTKDQVSEISSESRFYRLIEKTEY